MSKTAETIRSRLPDLCARVFTFAFQLRAKDKARGGTGDGEMTPIKKAPDPASMSGLPDIRGAADIDFENLADAFTTVAIQPFVSEAIQAAAASGKFEAEGEGGSGVSEDAWAEAEAMQLRVDGYFRELDSFAQQASEVTLMLRKDAPTSGRGKGTGLSHAHVQLAKYALAAFIDELVLMSTLPIREAWASKPLQLEHFDDFNAGEAFYDKIDELRRNLDDAGAQQVLEVYYACLALGFRGKFNGRQGMEKRKILIEQLARELAAVRARDIQSLAPNAIPVDEKPPAERKLSSWILPASFAGAFIVLFFLFSSMLGSMVADMQSQLKNAPAGNGPGAIPAFPASNNASRNSSSSNGGN
ncbi:MAG: DotU family type IV/VI secretion system protein [Planctomycetota bacterium]